MDVGHWENRENAQIALPHSLTDFKRAIIQCESGPARTLYSTFLWHVRIRAHHKLRYDFRRSTVISGPVRRWKEGALERISEEKMVFLPCFLQPLQPVIQALSILYIGAGTKIQR